MAKKKMASSKKTKSKKVSKIKEFLSAIRGFVPVWFTLVVLIGIGFGYSQVDEKFYEKLSSKLFSKLKDSKFEQIEISISGLKTEMNIKNVKQKVEQFIQQQERIDLTDIRQFVGNMPWMQEVSVKRLSPTHLDIYVEERKALVRWKDGGLISDRGELFFPENIKEYSGLAMLDCPEKTLSQSLKIMEEAARMMSTLNLMMSKIEMDDLGRWSLTTRDGLAINFGQKNIHEKLLKLKKIYPSVLETGKPKRIDLRYENGAAVSFS